MNRLCLQLGFGLSLIVWLANMQVAAKTYPCGWLKSPQDSDLIATIRVIDAEVGRERIGAVPDWDSDSYIVISTCKEEDCDDRALLPVNRDISLYFDDGELVIFGSDAKVTLLGEANLAPDINIGQGDPSALRAGEKLQFDPDRCVVPSPFATSK